jgi:hypothetical protein
LKNPGAAGAAYVQLFGVKRFRDADGEVSDPVFCVSQEKKLFGPPVLGDGKEGFVGLALQFQDPSDVHFSSFGKVFSSVFRPRRFH